VIEHVSARPSPNPAGAFRYAPGKYVDVPFERWREEELQGISLPSHVLQHLATMAKLHAANRYDRFTDTVRALTAEQCDLLGRPAAQKFVLLQRLNSFMALLNDAPYSTTRARQAAFALSTPWFSTKCLCGRGISAASLEMNPRAHTRRGCCRRATEF
jgi:hypothetical protein